MSRDPFFDAIRELLLPDATEIESLFGQYLGAQPEPVFIAHIAGDPKPQGSKRYAEADSNGPAITGAFLRIYKEKQ